MNSDKFATGALVESSVYAGFLDFPNKSPEVPKGTFWDCKRSPRSRASSDFGSSPLQKGVAMNSSITDFRTTSIITISYLFYLYLFHYICSFLFNLF